MNKGLIPIGKTAKLLGVSIDTLRRWDKNTTFNSVRIGVRGKRYYRISDIDLYLNDQLAVARKWAISDMGYEPQSEHYCRTRDIFQARLEHLQSDLIKNIHPNLASLVSAITGEIGNNSFDHNLGNWPDVLGIYFSYSLAQGKIILADRGLGILHTLKQTLPELKDHKEALKVAFTKIVSGRAPENRGNGLKFVRNVITTNPVTLFFQSGSATINLDQKNVDIITEETNEPIRGCLAVIQY